MANNTSSTLCADVNQDNQINTTDAMLLLRKSLGISMNGTGWCGE